MWLVHAGVISEVYFFFYKTLVLAVLLFIEGFGLIIRNHHHGIGIGIET